jgi:hypothetical protein
LPMRPASAVRNVDCLVPDASIIHPSKESVSILLRPCEGNVGAKVTTGNSRHLLESVRKHR